MCIRHTGAFGKSVHSSLLLSQQPILLLRNHIHAYETHVYIYTTRHAMRPNTTNAPPARSLADSAYNTTTCACRCTQVCVCVSTQRGARQPLQGQHCRQHTGHRPCALSHAAETNGLVVLSRDAQHAGTNSVCESTYRPYHQWLPFHPIIASSNMRSHSLQFHGKVGGERSPQHHALHDILQSASAATRSRLASSPQRRGRTWPAR